MTVALDVAVVPLFAVDRAHRCGRGNKERSLAERRRNGEYYEGDARAKVRKGRARRSDGGKRGCGYLIRWDGWEKDGRK